MPHFLPSSNNHDFVLLKALVAISLIAGLGKYQIAKREIETLARRFISHAHFACNQALHIGSTIYIATRFQNDWNSGWQVKSGCSKKPCAEKIWLMQENISPSFSSLEANNLADPILINARFCLMRPVQPRLRKVDLWQIAWF